MDTDTIVIDYRVVLTMSTHKFLFSVGGILYDYTGTGAKCELTLLE